MLPFNDVVPARMVAENAGRVRDETIGRSNGYYPVSFDAAFYLKYVILVP